MKNVKKFLAAAVCFIMLFQMCAVSADNLGVNVSEEALSDDMAFLNAIGIFDEIFSDITLTHKISRMDFAVAVARIFGNSVSEDEQEPASRYTDMAGMGVEAVKAVNLLSDTGIISGTGNNEFLPESDISCQQAVKILVCALGYETVAAKYGGFPDGYLIEGARLGITDGINLSGSDSLTWSGFICLLNNILNIDLMEITNYGSEPVYEVVKGDTLLNSVMKIKLLEDATITANNITDLQGGDGVDFGRARINGILFDDPDNLAAAYIGKKADVYYTDERDSNRTIIYVRSSYNSLSIMLDDIESIDGYKITYYDDNAGKVKTVTVADDAVLILNGLASAYMSESIKLDKSGFINLEKSSSSSSYDVVTAQIYTNMVVSAVDYENEIIYDKIADGRSLNLRDYIQNDRCNIEKNGVKTDINAIKENDILAVYDTPNSSYMNITVSSNVVTGKLEACSDDEITVNSVKYKLDDSLKDEVKGRIGSVFTVYLDISGVAVMIESARGDSQKYGYLIASAENNGIDSRLKFRILTDEGKVEDYRLSTKIKLNGSSVGKNVEDAVKGKLYTGGKLTQQLIQYSLNSDGEINLINSAEDMQGVVPDRYRDKDFYCAVPKSALKYKSGKKTFYGKFTIDDSTKIFLVPNKDSISAKDYATASASHFTNDDTYTVSAYNTDGGGRAEAVVCWENTRNISPSSASNMIMVDYISSVLNSDGDEVEQLHGLMNGKYVEYNVESDSDVSLTTGSRKLKRGDVIRAALNSRSEISGIKVEVDIDTQKSANPSLGSFWNQYWAISGAFYSKEGRYALISNKNAENLSTVFESPDPENLYSVTVSGTIMIYDEKADSVYAGTEADILTYKTSGEAASRFYMRFNYESVNNIFIFKYEP